MKSDSIYSRMFAQEMRDAVLTCDNEDYDRERDRIRGTGVERPKHSDVVKRCRRVIQPPAQLRANIDRVINKWKRRDHRLMQAR